MNLGTCHNCNKPACYESDRGVVMCRQHYLNWYNAKFKTNKKSIWKKPNALRTPRYEIWQEEKDKQEYREKARKELLKDGFLKTV